MLSDWAPTCLRLSPTASMNESWCGFFFIVSFYGGIISYSDMMEPSVTVDLCGGEQRFIFPTCPWVMRATKCWLCLCWILCCQQTILRGILPFLFSFQYSTSSFQKIVLPALCTGVFKVQLSAESEPAGPLSMQQLCEDSNDQLPTFIACELLVSNF